MSRIGFISDPHVGNHRVFAGKLTSGLNERCLEVLKTLRAAFVKAKEARCDKLVISGDLFDNDRPIPQIIAATQDAVADPPPDTILLLGNHDIRSTAQGDHAFGPLRRFCQVVADQPSVIGVGDVDLACIPFRPIPTGQWLEEALAGLRFRTDSVKALCFHAGISDEKTPEFLKGSADSISLKILEMRCLKHGIDLVFAGNWHEHRAWSCGSDKHPIDVVQIGTLCPTGFGDAGKEGFGKLVVYDSADNALEVFEIPGPRFIKVPIVTRDSTWSALMADVDTMAKAGNQVYVRVGAPPEQMPAARTRLQGLVEAGKIVDFEVVMEASGVKESTRTAAAAARKATRIDEALKVYIDAMPLEENVDRSRVQTLALRYLKEAHGV